MKKTLILVLSALLFLSSCSVADKGNDLVGFTGRLSKLGFETGADGFLIDESAKREYRYYCFGSSEILVSLQYDDRYCLPRADFSVNSASLSSDELKKFLSASVLAFAGSDKADAKEALDALDLKKALTQKTLNTKKQVKGNITLLLDVNDEGAVLTVLRTAELR